MGRSKYPEKYDTSVEIPQVRGNINEVGIDVLNSVRSAIFQIERTLGINPQGSATNSVADRLSKSLDLSGNIKKEAFDKAGVIYGQITNENISRVASIDESKLNLDFPTRLLQTELSLVIDKIDTLIPQIEEVSSKFSSHVLKDISGRHTSRSISVEEIPGVSSDTGLESISSGDLHTTLEDILNKHVKYSGLNISELNNSHNSNQIYFDNTNVSEYISSPNIQNAVEELALVAAGQQSGHQNIFHGNGYLNVSNLSILASNITLASGISVSFSKSLYTDSDRKTNISLITPQVVDFVEPSDLVEVALSSSSEVYVISDIIYDLSGNITNIIIFGSIPEASSSLSSISIYKRSKRQTSEWGLAPTIIENPNLLSADSIQIANPNSAGIVSKNFSSNMVEPGESFTLDINGKEYKVGCHNPSYLFQSLEAVISAINESLLEQGASALAYKVYSKKTSQYELAIVSNLYGEDTYLKILSSSSLAMIGLSDYADKIIYGTSGNNYIVNGVINSSIKEVLNLTGLTLDSGVNSISGIDFSAYDIKKGDIITISGSLQDDGSYIIINVTSSEIYVNPYQLTTGSWISVGDSATKFLISKNIINFENYKFLETSGFGNGSLFELIIDSSSNFVYRTKSEYTNSFLGNSFYSIIDCSQSDEDVIEEITFEIIDSKLYCYLDESDKKEITNYKNTNLTLYSKKVALYTKIIIYNSDDIESYISSLGVSSFSTNIYIYKKPDYDNILLIGNVSYSSAASRIEGSHFRLPYFYDLKDSGTIKLKDISEEVIRDLQVTPMKETRTSGVVLGLEITNVSTSLGSNYVVSVSSGIAYISGKRFILDAKENIDVGIPHASYDKIILFINNDGILFADSADSSTCNFYINSEENIVLGTIEYNSSLTQIIDQRIIISNLDLKLLNYITVSPVPGMGHFSSINSAIKYAKRFSQVYPNAGVPEIILKAGLHRVEVDIPVNYASRTNEDLINYYDKYGIYLDFPIKITGEGDSTVLDIITGYSDQPVSSDDRDSDAKNRGYILINGAGSTSYSSFSTDTFNDGNIILSNFKLKNSTILYIDPTILNTSTYNINFHRLKIKDVYFDWSNLIFNTTTFADTYYFNNGYAVKIISNTASPNDFMGGIDIHSCTFDTCYIDLSEDIYLLNISIKNNYFYSQNKKINSSANSFLIKNPNDITIAFFNNFYSNHISSNFSSAHSYLDNYDSYLFSNKSGTLSSYPSAVFSQKINTEDLTTYGNINLINIPVGSVSRTMNVGLPSTFSNTVSVSDELSVSGDLNVSGESTFTNTINSQNIVPNASSTYDIGELANFWDNIYVQNITTSFAGNSNLIGDVTLGLASSNNLTVNATANFNSNALFSTIDSNFIPSLGNTYDIGSSAVNWNNIYTSNLYSLIIDNIGAGSLGFIKTGRGLMVNEDQPPEARVHIKQSSNTTSSTYGPGVRLESSATSDFWDIQYSTGNSLGFAYNATRLGYLSAAGSDVSLNFTGQHKCCVDDSADISEYKNMVGLIVVSTGKYLNTIDDKNIATINESLPVIKLSDKPLQKSIFGVISDAEDINETSREYALGIFVSISEKLPTKEDTRVVVNSLGEGGVWVIDQGGNLENGDYITTSEVPGYGMKQDDDILRNYTVAKITQDCSFSNLTVNNKTVKEIVYNNKKYIAAFVGCTYHCG